MSRMHALSARQPSRARYFFVLALLAALATPWPALAADGDASADQPVTAESLQQLREALRQEQLRMQALEQRLAADEAALAKAQASAQANAQTTAPATPTLAAGNGLGTSAAVATNPNTLLGSFGPDGYTLASADGQNVIHFRGNVSVDDRYFSDSYTPVTADTWLIRRLRPTLEGTLDGNIDFRIMPDFAEGKTVLQDGWGDIRFEPWLVLQFGKFKAPVGLERLQLEQFGRFIEPSLTADLLPYRDLGFKVGGALGHGVFTYDVGTFDGTVDAGSTDGNSVPDYDSTGKFTWEGRVFARPFLPTELGGLKGLGFGVAQTYVKDSGVNTASTTTSLLASYKTTGQQSMFSYRSDTDPTTAGAVNNATIAQGIERRVVPQFYYYFRSVGLLGEYVDEAQQVQRDLTVGSERFATLHNSAWQLQGAWFVTGEDEAYDSATPRSDFQFGRGGTGAWELLARYHVLSFDPGALIGGSSSFANPASAPRMARAIGTGANWYLDRNFKIQLDYEVTSFVGGATGGNRPDERVLTTQFALIF
jgi:phosphate-selective porin OprO and OprP